MFMYLQAQAKAATENSEKAKQAEVWPHYPNTNSSVSSPYISAKN